MHLSCASKGVRESVQDKYTARVLPIDLPTACRADIRTCLYLLTCASEPSSGLGTAVRSTAAFGLDSVCTCTNMSVAQTPGVHASALTRLLRRRSRPSNAAVNTRLPSLDWWYRSYLPRGPPEVGVGLGLGLGLG